MQLVLPSDIIGSLTVDAPQPCYIFSPADRKLLYRKFESVVSIFAENNLPVEHLNVYCNLNLYGNQGQAY